MSVISLRAKGPALGVPVVSVSHLSLVPTKGKRKDRERSRNQCSHCWKTRFSDPRSVSKGLKGTLRFCTKGSVKEGVWLTEQVTLLSALVLQKLLGKLSLL